MLKVQRRNRSYSDRFFTDDKATYELTSIRKVSGRLKRLLTGDDGSAIRFSHRHRLLVVDDEESVCFAISDYLGQYGFAVDTATDIDEAQVLIDSTEYKVIIQDLRLGTTTNLDGLAIIRKIHRQNPMTRIVVLTAYGSPETEAEARRCGASAFLLKPKPLPVVAQVIQGLID
jgi:DNA-binding NtrC family response regulator